MILSILSPDEHPIGDLEAGDDDLPITQIGPCKIVGKEQLALLCEGTGYRLLGTETHGKDK